MVLLKNERSTLFGALRNAATKGMRAKNETASRISY
jgi:hypothetical protein